MKTQMISAGELSAGQCVLLDDSFGMWTVVAAENRTGLVVQLQLAHTKDRRPPRTLNVFPDQLIAAITG